MLKNNLKVEVFIDNNIYDIVINFKNDPKKDNKYYHRAFLNKIMIITVVFKQKISFYLRKVLYSRLEI